MARDGHAFNADVDDVPLSLADARPPEFSDEAIALRFAALHMDELRYVAQWHRWMEWDVDDGYWRRDDTLRVFNFARTQCRIAAAGADQEHIARAIASAKTVAAVERLARADRRLAATVDVWDADPWVLITKGARDGSD